MANCIVYPNLLIRGDNDIKSFFKLINKDFTVVAFEYLYNSYCADGTCRLSLNHMINWCGYKVNSNKDKSVDKFKELLYEFKKLKIINFDCDIGSYKVNDFIIVDSNIKDYTQNSFFMVDSSAKDSIMSYSKNKLNNLKMYNYYCYICSRMYNGTGEVIGGKYNNCFFSFDKANYDLGYSKSTITKFNDILKELKLIDYGNIGKLVKGNKIITGVNYYVLTKIYHKGKYIDYDYKLHLKEGLKYSLNYYIEKGYNNTPTAK